MNMVATAYYQKFFSWWFLKPPFLLFLVTLIPSTAFFCFLISSHGFFSLLTTITVLFISTSLLLLKFSKDKTRFRWDDRPVQEQEDEKNPKLQLEEDVSATTLVTQTQACVAQEDEAGFKREMTDLPCDSETSSETEENEGLELECVSSSRMNLKGSVSDVSSCFDDDDDDGDDGGGGDDDEDEDGLIEIALMHDGSNGFCEEPQLTLENFWVQYSREEEINDNDVNIEEENLIEIDISMGSIKRISS